MTRHDPRWGWVPLVALMLAVGEWLRQPGPLWLLVAGGGLLALWWLRWPARTWASRFLLALSAALALTMVLTERRLGAIESNWDHIREARLEAASRQLGGYLRRAFDHLDQLVSRGASSNGNDRNAAFAELAQAIPDDGPDFAITIFEADGTPWAWAGRSRLPPVPLGDSIAVSWNRYYLLLEMRRHFGPSRMVVATVVISADQATADPERSVAFRFRSRTGIGLEVFPPGLAPDDDPDIYDYTEPTTAGPRILFSVKPIPPQQGAAKELTLHAGRAAVAWLLLALFLTGIAVLPTPVGRFALIFGLLTVILRAPFGGLLGMEELFSPATFFRPLLGPFSTSVGVMAATGIVLTLLGVALWRLQLPRHWAGLAVGAGALIVAPDMYRELGRGITPPSDGVSLSLWLTWQVTMAVAASALFGVAAALFRGNNPIAGNRWKTWFALGIVLALVAAVAGTYLWSPGPHVGWPPSYTLLWIPPLFLILVPAPRWATASAIALVAGGAAALVSWGAVMEGSIAVAQRDVARLGTNPDPLAVASLERLGEDLDVRPTPTTTAEVYRRWRLSDLGAEGYPVRLSMWAPDGRRLSTLALDSLAVPLETVQRAVTDLPVENDRAVHILMQVPGVHYLLVARTESGAILTATVGPQTQLISKTQLGRMLEPAARFPPLYQIRISPPLEGPGYGTVPMGWGREGWTVFGEGLVAFPESVRRVRVDVDLRGPGPLFVRGALVILLDVAIIAFLWLAAEWLGGTRIGWPNWPRLRRSFRIRLAATLSLFFLLPAVGFAAWSFLQMADEVRRSRDLVAEHTLQDAVAVSEGLDEASDVVVLRERFSTEFWTYRAGRLHAVTTPGLEELGLVRPLVDPRAFVPLVLGGALEVNLDEEAAGRRDRIGYRLARAGTPSSQTILATPHQANAPGLVTRQLDLAFVLLLTLLTGLTAALFAARWAARALSRPVSDLRVKAIALGQGRDIPPPARTPPLEFEPVFGAFERMEHDIRTSQADLEAARHRTATVLATVATGVVGLDQEGRVLIANRRAADFLGVTLDEGAALTAVLDSAWAPLLEAIQPLLAGATGDRNAEIDVHGRRYSVHTATLGPDIGGVVVALTDVTDLAQAERVLAWGEMARQVAHEIKNPLTPIRLGMQHLGRVYRERPDTFGEALEETSGRVLTEIDRLDRIARAFSRFAAPADDDTPLDDVDLGETATEVVQLYRLAADEAVVDLEVAPDTPCLGAARRDQVKEVLVNLLENARQAGATRITVSIGRRRLRVADNGRGIPTNMQARIFEPRFSTTSSGAGLGLAIVQRLVGGWGGSIAVVSEVGEGTEITIDFAKGDS